LTDSTPPYPQARFLVEVPRTTIEAFVRFGFIRSDQQDDLAAIKGALRIFGQVPAVSRIASAPLPDSWTSTARLMDPSLRLVAVD
jgi:hypothetical protein